MKKLHLLFILILLSACSDEQASAPDSEQLVMSTLWYQHSAEMRALYYQAFNLAEFRVTEKLADYDGEKPPAVVVDIDETMLDNSLSEAKNILEGERYSTERWRSWTGKAMAKPLPGSLDFAKFLTKAGVELFYISNRNVAELQATKDNLVKTGFPDIKEDHILLKSETSDKTERRNKVSDNYEILLLIGDNLGDFSGLFDERSENYGKDLVDEFRNEFGKRFIVLPNPIYGSWTSALFGSTRDMSPTDIAVHRKKFLLGY